MQTRNQDTLAGGSLMAMHRAFCFISPLIFPPCKADVEDNGCLSLGQQERIHQPGVETVQ